MRNPFPCLWFDGKAEEAARFYTSLLPGSSVDQVWRSPADTPSGPAGMVLTVDFTLNGQHFQGLNGGPEFSFNEAVSFVIECEDQDEVDRLWDALTADGGEPGPCGWLKDRFGLSWQIVPRQLNELVGDTDPERARRAMEAMLKMGKIDVAELQRAADTPWVFSRMSKLIYITNTSLDGCVEDEAGAFRLGRSRSVHAFIAELLQPIRTDLYGRRLYETMAYVSQRLAFIESS
jgi:predicted 3-demethylubiquinone-9 3-methyltransferase (glyoxalase superfamily)